MMVEQDQFGTTFFLASLAMVSLCLMLMNVWKYNRRTTAPENVIQLFISMQASLLFGSSGGACVYYRISTISTISTHSIVMSKLNDRYRNDRVWVNG